MIIVVLLWNYVLILHCQIIICNKINSIILRYNFSFTSNNNNNNCMDREENKNHFNNDNKICWPDRFSAALRPEWTLKEKLEMLKIPPCLPPCNWMNVYEKKNAWFNKLPINSRMVMKYHIFRIYTVFTYVSCMPRKWVCAQVSKWTNERVNEWAYVRVMVIDNIFNQINYGNR